jgi:hypothetical protein
MSSEAGKECKTEQSTYSLKQIKDFIIFTDRESRWSDALSPKQWMFQKIAKDTGGLRYLFKEWKLAAQQTIFPLKKTGKNKIGVRSRLLTLTDQ